MIHYDVAQGEPEWFSLRIGIPTASEFGKIMTPKTLKLSAQAEEYADAKIAEMMTGQPQTGPMFQTYYMERGQLLEVEAREAYEFTNNVRVTRGGFITDDKGHYGCSPDFLVGDDGMGEIKCLMPKNHITCLISQKVQPDHMPQVQGGLWISGRKWNDWTMYHPELPRFEIRTYRDEAYISSLADCMDQFRTMMSEKIQNLMDRGLFSIAKPIEKKTMADLTGAG